MFGMYDNDDDGSGDDCSQQWRGYVIVEMIYNGDGVYDYGDKNDNGKVEIIFKRI